jgi:hypothetical protein
MLCALLIMTSGATSSAIIPNSSRSALRPWHFLLFAVVYVYAFPYFNKLRSAQEIPRLILTLEIVDHGTFSLNQRMHEFVSRNDISIGPDKRIYSNKSPGPSLVAVPVYLLAKALGVTSIRGCMWAFRIGAIALPTILFLPIFYRLAGRFSQDEYARRAALSAYAIGSPVLVYAQMLLGHQLAGICLGTAFFFSTRVIDNDSRRPLLLAAVAGFFASLAPAMDYQATLVAPLIGLYLFFRTPTDRWRRTMVFGLASLPGLTGLAAYHQSCFGSPFKIGYAYGIDRAPETGILGFIGPNLDSFYHILLAPSNGLLVMVPWVLLAAVGVVILFRDKERWVRLRGVTVTCVIVAGVYLLFVGSMLPYMARGGWSAGPRQLVATLPFLGWLSVAGFEWAGRRMITTVVVTGLVITSGIIFLAAVTTYPHWPDGLTNPLYDLSFPLLSQGYSVHSLGTLLGLRGIPAVIPLFVFALGMILWLQVGHRPRPFASGLLGILFATMLLVGYSYFPRSGPYAQHVQRFAISQWEPTK